MIFPFQMKDDTTQRTCRVQQVAVFSYLCVWRMPCTYIYVRPHCFPPKLRPPTEEPGKCVAASLASDSSVKFILCKTLCNPERRGTRLIANKSWSACGALKCMNMYMYIYGTFYARRLPLHVAYIYGTRNNYFNGTEILCNAHLRE